MDPQLVEVTQFFERFKAALLRNDFATSTSLLSQLKVLLTNFPSLPPSFQKTPTAVQELTIARDIYEHAVVLSIKMEDQDAFERDFFQLKPYYTDTCPESKKSKKKSGSEASGNVDPCPQESAVNTVPVISPPPVPQPEEVKLSDAWSEQKKQALAPAEAADAAEAVCLRTQVPSRYIGMSVEERAAIRIQTAFRGHLARRALRALRGLVRLKSLIDGNSVKRQAATTLRCMQTLARVQAQIRARRIRMSEENQALQRQLLLKHEREQESLKLGEIWDDSLQTKEQIEASLLSKQEAALRRERAMAYAFSHQWKSTSRSVNPMFMDPNNPQWGWSWLERWMAARPWETKKTTDKELNNDTASVKSSSQSVGGGGEIIKAYARRDINPDKPSPGAQKLPRPASRQSPSTPKAPWVMPIGKVKSASQKFGWAPSEDDSRSILSTQSEKPRRHSIATASVRDDESLASSANFPSYMAPTESARAKSRLQSLSSDVLDIPDNKSSAGYVKKRLSFPAGDKYGAPASPAMMRRHSGPPKVAVASVKDVEVHS